MKPYPSYKDSGVEWVGEIPSQWNTTKNKYYFKEKNSEVGEKWKDYPLLSLTKKGIIFRDVESGKGKFPGSFENYKVVEVGDLVFCLYDIEETPRTVGLSEYNGMITGSYKIFVCDNVNSKFIYYYYLTIDDFKGLRPFYTGLRNVVRPETFKSLKINLPPLAEQTQIASFLDHKTQLIDSLIEKTAKKIELLKEKRTALINHCVTKGLNQNAEMKDSGIEWIGEMPKRWILSKLKFYTTTISKGTTPTTIGREIETEGMVRFIKGENISESGLDFKNEYFIDKETHQILKRSQLHNNDILFVIAGTIGKVCPITEKHLPANTSQAISFIRLKSSENHSFFLFLLKSEIIKRQFDVLVVQSAQPNLSMEDLSNINITYPPHTEQQKIVEYLDEQTQKIDSTIENESQRIELLKEYRQSLISEVVTGKIDVRGWNME